MTFPQVPLESVKSVKPHSFVGGPFGSELTTRDYVAEGVPVIRGNNLAGPGNFHDDDFAYVSEEKATSLRSNTAYPGDLLFTQRGTLGQVGLIPSDARFARYVVSQSQMKLTVDDEKANSLFLYYFFRLPSTVQQLLAKVSSSGVPHINLSILKAFEVPLPPKPTQDAIVRMVKPYDDLIENNRRRIQLLEDAARLLYQEWFVRFRFPGGDKIKLIDGRPQNWDCKPISESVVPQYGFTETATAEPVGPKFLRGTDINKASYIDWDSVPFCPAARLNFDKYALKPDDILVIRMADPGKVAIVEREIKAVFASYLVRLQVRPGEELLPLYLFYLMSDSSYRGFIAAASAKATRKSASAPLLTMFPALIPPRGLQQKFVEAVAPMRKQLNTLLQQNAALKTARDLLLPRLMSGEVEV